MPYQRNGVPQSRDWGHASLPKDPVIWPLAQLQEQPSGRATAKHKPDAPRLAQLPSAHPLYPRNGAFNIVTQLVKFTVSRHEAKTPFNIHDDCTRTRSSNLRVYWRDWFSC